MSNSLWYASGFYKWEWMRNMFVQDSRIPTKQVITPRQLEGAGLLVLWGGEDISPSIYGQKVVRANADDLPSYRDKVEMNLIHAAKHYNVPILGICRGAQLLCAMGGGTLYQHVENHIGRDHEVRIGSDTYWTNSCHHQMMIPTEDMQVIGTAPYLSKRKWIDQSEPVLHKSPEAEVVYMPELNALAVQGHPEWMDYDGPFVKKIRSLMLEILHVEI